MSEILDDTVRGSSAPTPWWPSWWTRSSECSRARPPRLTPAAPALIARTTPQTVAGQTSSSCRQRRQAPRALADRCSRRSARRARSSPQEQAADPGAGSRPVPAQSRPLPRPVGMRVRRTSAPQGADPGPRAAGGLTTGNSWTPARRFQVGTFPPG
ncbi:hypothetical protein QJS66_14370 [Kocuria rhizophila]|nr:hypothetical protein QJS66_14370 [Kocuria rhizophila]